MLQCAQQKLKVDLVTYLPKSKSSSLKSKSKSFLFKSKSKCKCSKNGLQLGLKSKSGLEYYKSGINIDALKWWVTCCVLQTVFVSVIEGLCERTKYIPQL